MLSSLAVCWLAALAGAAEPARCVVKLPSGEYNEPASADELRKCHGRERDAYVDAMFGKKVGKGEVASLKALETRQQREADDYASRHPQARLRLTEAPASAETTETAETPPAPKVAHARKPAADLASLKRTLDDQADGGRHGISPEMAEAVRDYLRANQGSISPDMDALLDATSKDGVNLSASTMKKLQGAARQAKASGLDLGVKPDIEQALLNEEIEEKPKTPGGM